MLPVLRRGLAMRLSNPADDRVCERAPLRVTSVDHDSTNRRPGLRQNAMRGVDSADGPLREIWVYLDLVHGRYDVDLLEERVHVFRHEIAHADRPDLAIAQQRLQRVVGLDGQVETRRKWLVEDEQIDAVDAELARALVESVQSFVVA
jgi:hypothetical protein